VNVRKRNLSSEQMLFQVSAFSAAKLSLVAAARLWDGFGMFSKEDGNFLVYSLADIDCAMDMIGRFVPIDLPGCDFDVVARVSVSEFDPQGIAAEDDRYAMAWVTMPRRAHAGCETQASNQRCSSSVEDFLGHSLDPSRHRTNQDLAAQPISGCLHFDSRGMSRNTLPLPVWHLHPRIGPALIFSKRLTRCIGSLAIEATGRDGRIAENGNLQIVVLRTVVFDRFRPC
jgi:hypothetical protein